MSGDIVFAKPVPIGGGCHATDYTASGEAQTFVLNTVIAGYVGPVEVTATGHDGCANGLSQSGTLSVTASGETPNGSSLQCGPLVGTYDRVVTTGTIDVSGPCTVTGHATGDIRFVSEAVAIPAPQSPFATAAFVAPFTAFPDA